MNKYFFDSYSIIELILGNDNYSKFKDIKIFTTVLNIMEVYYYLLREYDKKTADFWIKKLDAELINIMGLETVLEASRLKFQYKKEKLSYIDCIGYVISKKFNAKFLTGDEQFKNFENVEFVK